MPDFSGLVGGIFSKFIGGDTTEIGGLEKPGIIENLIENTTRGAINAIHTGIRETTGLDTRSIHDSFRSGYSKSLSKQLKAAPKKAIKPKSNNDNPDLRRESPEHLAARKAHADKWGEPTKSSKDRKWNDSIEPSPTSLPTNSPVPEAPPLPPVAKIPAPVVAAVISALTNKPYKMGRKVATQLVTGIAEKMPAATGFNELFVASVTGKTPTTIEPSTPVTPEPISAPQAALSTAGTTTTRAIQAGIKETTGISLPSGKSENAVGAIDTLTKAIVNKLTDLNKTTEENFTSLSTTTGEVADETKKTNEILSQLRDSDDSKFKNNLQKEGATPENTLSKSLQKPEEKKEGGPSLFSLDGLLELLGGKALLGKFAPAITEVITTAGTVMAAFTPLVAAIAAGTAALGLARSLIHDDDVAGTGNDAHFKGGESAGQVSWRNLKNLFKSKENQEKGPEEPESTPEPVIPPKSKSWLPDWMTFNEEIKRHPEEHGRYSLSGEETPPETPKGSPTPTGETEQQYESRISDATEARGKARIRREERLEHPPEPEVGIPDIAPPTVVPKKEGEGWLSHIWHELGIGSAGAAELERPPLATDQPHGNIRNDNEQPNRPMGGPVDDRNFGALDALRYNASGMGLDTGLRDSQFAFPGQERPISEPLEDVGFRHQRKKSHGIPRVPSDRINELLRKPSDLVESSINALNKALQGIPAVQEPNHTPSMGNTPNGLKRLNSGELISGISPPTSIPPWAATPQSNEVRGISHQLGLPANTISDSQILSEAAELKITPPPQPRSAHESEWESIHRLYLSKKKGLPPKVQASQVTNATSEAQHGGAGGSSMSQGYNSLTTPPDDVFTSYDKDGNPISMSPEAAVANAIEGHNVHGMASISPTDGSGGESGTGQPGRFTSGPAGSGSRNTAPHAAGEAPTSTAPREGEGGRAQPSEGVSRGGEAPTKPGEAGQYRPVYTLSEKDTSQAVINTIAGEARLKDPKSVDAVINTMLNRVGSKGYGPSGNLAEVAAAPQQFAGYNKGHPTAAQTEMIKARIEAIASGKVADITHGANEFRTTGYQGPWGQKHRDAPDIGGNQFANNPKSTGTFASYSHPKESVQPAAALQPGGGSAGGAGASGDYAPRPTPSISKEDLNKANLSRPNRYEGKISIPGVDGKSQEFDYATGGAGRGSSTYGAHPITGFMTEEQRRQAGMKDMTHGGKRSGDTFSTKDYQDPKHAGEDARRGIDIHSGSSSDIHKVLTEGCFGIPKDQWPAAEKAIQARVSSLGGHAVMNVDPNTHQITIDAPGSSPTQPVDSFVDQNKGKGPNGPSSTKASGAFNDTPHGFDPAMSSLGVSQPLDIPSTSPEAAVSDAIANKPSAPTSFTSEDYFQDRDQDKADNAKSSLSNQESTGSGVKRENVSPSMDATQDKAQDEGLQGSDAEPAKTTSPPITGGRDLSDASADKEQDKAANQGSVTVNNTSQQQPAPRDSGRDPNASKPSEKDVNATQSFSNYYYA